MSYNISLTFRYSASLLVLIEKVFRKNEQWRVVHLYFFAGCNLKLFFPFPQSGVRDFTWVALVSVSFSLVKHDE